MSTLALPAVTWICLVGYQKCVCRIIGPTLAAFLEPLALHQNVVSLIFLCRYYFGRCLTELAELLPLPNFPGRSTHYSDG